MGQCFLLFWFCPCCIWYWLWKCVQFCSWDPLWPFYHCVVVLFYDSQVFHMWVVDDNKVVFQSYTFYRPTKLHPVPLRISVYQVLHVLRTTIQWQIHHHGGRWMMTLHLWHPSNTLKTNCPCKKFIHRSLRKNPFHILDEYNTPCLNKFHLPDGSIIYYIHPTIKALKHSFKAKK